MFEHPHRRYNPLIGEWILVSAYRTQRPWQGKEEEETPLGDPSYDPDCYLCPGNNRTGGITNPDYTGTFVFENDFPTLLADVSSTEKDEDGLIKAKAEKGICRVICFSPLHNLTLPQMDHGVLKTIIEEWVYQYLELANRPDINHVQIFENKGAAMGASNPHPHCQIWASSSIPTEPAKEIAACRQYTKIQNSCLLCDYLDLEIQKAERLVVSNAGFVVVVPFWASWPFETLVISRRHVPDLSALTSDEQRDLADILKRLAIRYDNLFQIAFPYSMGFHQCPTDGGAYPELHLHAHFYPPLLRSANIRKFMVGYEMLAEPQRDITAEAAARQLNRLSETHFQTGSSRR